MASTEKLTQQAILEYLTLKKVFHYRQNSGALKTKTGFYRFCSMNGVPDIVAVKDGVYYAIEVKDKKGKQQTSQVQFQKRIERAGGVYILAKSIDDVMVIL